MSGLAEGGYVDGLEELVATRDQVEAILRNVSEGVTVASRDGRFVYANERAARAIGFETVDELLATSFESARERFEVFHADGRRMEPAELPARRAFSGEETGDVLVRFRPAGGGEERVSVVRAVPVLDADGRVQLVVSFFREVTEERRRAARESFIAEAGNLIGSTLDYESTLRAVASLAVPRLADWCLIDLVAADGSLQRVATEHADPAREALSEELQRR